MRKRVLRPGGILGVLAQATFVLSFLLAAGCATSPEKIIPSHMSDSSYVDWGCEELSREQSRLAASLSAAADEQRRCRDNDIAGVILLGFPVSGISGCDKEFEIARLKGQLQALQRAAVQKDCALPLVPASAAP